MGNCLQAQKAIQQQQQQVRPVDLESTSSVENVDSILFEISPERKYISRCWNESEGEEDSSFEVSLQEQEQQQQPPVFLQLSGKNQHVTLLPLDNTLPSTPGSSTSSPNLFGMSPPPIIKLRKNLNLAAGTSGEEDEGLQGPASEGSCSDTVHTDDSMEEQEVELVGVSKILEDTNNSSNNKHSNSFFPTRLRRSDDDDEQSVVSELVEYFERLIEENTQPENANVTLSQPPLRKPSSLLITIGGPGVDDDLSLDADEELSFSAIKKEPHVMPQDCKVDIRTAIHALQEQGLQA